MMTTAMSSNRFITHRETKTAKHVRHHHIPDQGRNSHRLATVVLPHPNECRCPDATNGNHRSTHTRHEDYKSIASSITHRGMVAASGTAAATEQSWTSNNLRKAAIDNLFRRVAYCDSTNHLSKTLLCFSWPLYYTVSETGTALAASPLEHLMKLPRTWRPC